MIFSTTNMQAYCNVYSLLIATLYFLYNLFIDVFIFSLLNGIVVMYSNRRGRRAGGLTLLSEPIHVVSLSLVNIFYYSFIAIQGIKQSVFFFVVTHLHS